jgi:hypothetical protein
MEYVASDILDFNPTPCDIFVFKILSKQHKMVD